MPPTPSIVPPGPDQESVWDYPRPPRVAPDGRRVRVEVAGVIVADSVRAVRVLETAGAPCWYLPAGDVRMDLLRPADGTTLCEWKGVASYFDVVVGDGEAVGRRHGRTATRIPGMRCCEIGSPSSPVASMLHGWKMSA